MSSHDPRLKTAFRVVTILLFVMLSEAAVIVWLWNKLPDGVATSGSIFPAVNPNLIREAYPDVDFEKVYPELSPGEIDQLQRESWSLRYRFEPFVQFAPFTVSQKFVVTTPAGFRQGDLPEVWPPRDEDFVVFVFGGSTTFGYGLPNEETVVNRLEDSLAAHYPDRNVECYNFGRGYFFSTQERILFAQLLSDGMKPDMAIFIDGLNDYYFYDGDPEFTTVLAQQVAPDLPLRGRTALTKDQYPPAVEAILERYAANTRLIRGMAAEFAVPVVFVGQPVPFAQFDVTESTYPYRALFAGHELCAWGYKFFRLAAEAGNFGDRFVWCGDVLQGGTVPQYVDCVHYSANASTRFAQAIVERAGARGLLPTE